MATIVLPHRDRLLQLLSYDPMTGDLRWKERPMSDFANANVRIGKAWNTANAGNPALTRVNSNGYMGGTLEGKSVLAHRIIWKLMTGKDADQVDHIDGVRTNNQWANLRDVDVAGNQKNTQLRKSNKTGVPGVMRYKRWSGSEPTYWVRIGAKTLGYFKNYDEAVSVRKAAEIGLGYHKNHGRPSAASPINSHTGDSNG